MSEIETASGHRGLSNSTVQFANVSEHRAGLLRKDSIGRRSALFLAASAPFLLASACSSDHQGKTARLPSTSATPRLAPPKEPGQVTIDEPQRTDMSLTEIDRRVPTAWGTDLPGITSRIGTVPGRRTLALTFDACGGPHGSGIDHAVLDALHATGTPATVFLNKRWVDANPTLARDFAADPLIGIENHGTEHVPLSVSGRSAYGIAGTENAWAALREIEENRAHLLETLGVESNWFRSGTAFYDDVAVDLARSAGVAIAGFGVNADFGATAPAPTVLKRICAAPDGAIVLMHMNQPRSGTAAGLRGALDELAKENVHFVRLSDISPP